MAIKIAGTEVINDNKELVLAKLTEINSSIADTAVDVFVYDTSQDSDGGAWRHRTQHTSWYNETLNTATRGSRKEFPAVAVIVAESNQVTIYDGDDPDLPMWMVFNAGTHKLIGMATGGVPGDITCMTAYQGVIAIGIGAGSARGLTTANLIAERAYYYSTGTSSRGFNGNIAERNDAKDDYALPDIGPIVAIEVNDVAMTVLPNAPIDAATGLPVPTIAVATDGGVSVIKDDGTVVDITGTPTNKGSSVVSFDPNNKLFFNTQNSNGLTTYLFLKAIEIPSSDTSNTNAETYNAFSGSPSVSLNTGASTSSTSNITSLSNGGSAVGFSDKLTRLYEHPEDITKGMVAYTTSDYNTGWMNGDIKLATLSDTDDTDVTGSELVTNGDFSSALGAEWDLTTGSGTIAIVSGQLEITQGSYSSIMYAAQDFTTVAGKKYTLSFKVVATTEANYFRVKVGTSANATDLGVTSTLTAAGEYNITFTATGTTSWVTLHSDQNANKKTTWDNVSVRLAEEDRSVNGNGLQVFGTVTKNPVATGADLVAYSGFSTSNYLQQPYNSDLDWGTGDFCYMGWAKWDGVDANQAVISRSSTDGQDDRIDLEYSDAANAWRFYTRSAGTAITVAANANASSGVWTHLTALRRNGVIELFVNGVSQNTATQTANLTDTHNSPTNIGTGVYSGNSFGGSIALIRISATAPSPEQIKKIYEDEKVLFQENAQATLYGSSDAVTALAYDDSTNLLHVGTSEGRSVFQGLRRVDNTTTAVGAAISASNGLVADE